MGALKHVVLPLFAIIHGLIVYTVATGKDSFPKLSGWPNADMTITKTESHLMGALAAAHLALMMNCIAGILLENSHYRFMAVLVEAVYYAGDAFDAYVTGFPLEFLLAMTFVAVAGLVINSSEPGVFTKDKALKVH